MRKSSDGSGGKTDEPHTPNRTVSSIEISRGCNGYVSLVGGEFAFASSSRVYRSACSRASPACFVAAFACWVTVSTSVLTASTDAITSVGGFFYVLRTARSVTIPTARPAAAYSPVLNLLTNTPLIQPSLRRSMTFFAVPEVYRT